MNLSQLRFALAAAAELSFSRAAERCNVTQPTLSSGIALLEEEFGGQLFVRTTRKVELSPFGEKVVPLIQAVMRAQEELEAGVRAFYRPAHMIVRIGLSPLVDARLVAQLLEPYRGDHPGVETFFREFFVEDLDDRLRKAQLDLAVRPQGARATTRKAFVRTPLYEEDLLFLPRHTSAAPTGEGPIRLEDVADETFVLCASGCGLEAATRSLFAEAGIRLREYSGQALSYPVMQEWADIGIGAAILPASKIAPGLRPHARRLLLAVKRPARMSFEAVWMREHAHPAHVADLHRHFRKRAPKLVAGAAGR